MPTIRPIDIADCQAFIDQHRQEIRSGVYDIEIVAPWAEALDEATLLFLARHCAASMLTLAKSEDAPTSVLELLADSPYGDVRCVVARNPRLPERALNQLAIDRDTDVIEGVLDNPGVSAKTLENVVKRYRRWDKHSDPWRVQHIKVQAIRHPRVSMRVLEVLARDADYRVRNELAQSAQTPAEILAILAQDKNEDVRLAVAANPSATAVTLGLLARDRSPKSRAAVARNPSASGASLKVLARDAEPPIRKEVAGNSNTSAPILDILARDADNEVRIVVAGNSNTLGTALEVLGRDADDRIRTAVAGNPSTPSAVLEILARDTKVEVQIAVAFNPSTPKGTWSALASYGKSHDVGIAALCNPRHTAIDQRLELARDQHTPKTILGVLAHNPDTSIQQQAAETMRQIERMERRRREEEEAWRRREESGPNYN